MTAAFRATYADWKLIKTRQCVQVVFEIPLSDSDVAYASLGGMPDPAKERWFGIARLTQAKEVSNQAATPSHPMEPRTPPSGARKSPSQMAGILCEDARFRTYLREHDMLTDNTAEAAAVAVRLICGVRSRSEFDKDEEAKARWDALYGRYQAWLMVAA